MYYIGRRSRPVIELSGAVEAGKIGKKITFSSTAMECEIKLKITIKRK